MYRAKQVLAYGTAAVFAASGCAILLIEPRPSTTGSIAFVFHVVADSRGILRVEESYRPEALLEGMRYIGVLGVDGVVSPIDSALPAIGRIGCEVEAEMVEIDAIGGAKPFGAEELARLRELTAKSLQEKEPLVAESLRTGTVVARIDEQLVVQKGARLVAILAAIGSLLFLPVVIRMYVRDWVSKARRSRACCAFCGYPIGGSARCPECGTSAEIESSNADTSSG